VADTTADITCVERFAQGDVVKFAGPTRAGDYWPKPGELGLVEDVYDEAVVVRWELARGPATWPATWLNKVSDEVELVIPKRP